MPTLPAAVRPIRGLDVCRLANSGMGSFVQPGTSVRPSGLTHSHSLLAQPMGGGLGGSQRGQAVGMQLHEDTELLHPLPSSQVSCSVVFCVDCIFCIVTSLSRWFELAGLHLLFGSPNMRQILPVIRFQFSL